MGAKRKTYPCHLESLLITIGKSRYITEVITGVIKPWLERSLLEFACQEEKFRVTHTNAHSFGYP